MPRRDELALPAVAAADALVLVLARPHLDRLALITTSPGRAIAALGADRFAATLAGASLWGVAVWVALGLLVAVGARLPGLAGRTCRSAARLVLPAVARRILIGSAGLGLALAPGIATAAPAAHPTPAATVLAAGAPGRPGPAWPTTTPTLPTPGPPTPTLPTPTPTPTLPTPTPTPTPPTTARSHEVRVRAGDSLWLLAGRRLGPDAGAAQVAAYWPRIYTANRDVIGTDPDAVSPGQRLQLPDPPPAHAPLPHRANGATP